MDIEPGVSEPQGEMPLRKAVGYVLLAVVPFLIVAMFYVGAYAKAWYERRGPAYNHTVMSQECHDIKTEVGFALDQTLEVLHRGSGATRAEKRAAADRLRAVMPDEESAREFERWASTHARDLGMEASDQLYYRKRAVVKANGCEFP